MDLVSRSRRRRRKNKTERLVGRRKGKEGGNQYFKAWFYTGQSCLKSKHLHRAGNFILYIWITNVLKAVSWCPVIKHPKLPSTDSLSKWRTFSFLPPFVPLYSSAFFSFISSLFHSSFFPLLLSVYFLSFLRRVKFAHLFFCFLIAVSPYVFI